MRRVQSTLFTLLTASTAAHADMTLNLTQGVSPISHDVYELHMTVFWICVLIGIVVFSAMFYSIMFHRKSKDVTPAKFHSHPWLEIAWTIVPALILIVLAIPATKVLFNMNNKEKDEVTIKITGYQWKWQYEYLEDNIKFFSNLSTPIDQMRNLVPKGPHYLREVDHQLVLPIHKKIRFLITSNDVNHAWWVPDFAVKRDAIAGFINEAWTIIDKPGTYYGQCAELCGINHAFMPIVVVATTEQGFKNWVAKQKGEAGQGEADTNREWAFKELMEQGEKTYMHICAACHQQTGTGLPPTFPALKGSKVTTGAIEKHIETVMNGVSGTAMQAFKQQLTPVELASVITYERNAWGNNTKSMVQPIQIKAYRDGMSMKEALAVKPSPMPLAGTDAAAQAKPDRPPVSPAKAPKVTAKDEEAASPSETAPPQTSKPEETPKPAEAAIKEAMARGEKTFLSVCAICHQPTGLGMPPTFPALKGSKVATGPVENHLHIVLFGKQQTAMQPFKDLLSDQELADVITYERNAWGNNTGSMLTADQIKKARESTQNNSQSGGTS